MKKRLSFLSIIMAFLLVFSCFSVGCTEEQSGGEQAIEQFKEKGVHYREVEETNNYIINSGSTEYKILLPEEPMNYEVMAAETINEFMLKATGVAFPIVYDDVYNNADDGKFISIGTTALIRKTGISLDIDKFGQSGYRMKTIGDDVYISGAHAFIREGTYYAALDFLKETINWRCYSYDEIKYDVKSNVEFSNYDIVEIPEFDHRAYSVKQLLDSDAWQRYLRLNVKEETRINVTGHSHFDILDPKVYYEDHKDWYYFAEDADGDGILDDKEGQLCLSNTEMQQEFIKNVVQRFRDNPDTNFIHLGQQDFMVECPCNDCKAYKIYYDEDGKEQTLNYAGIMVKFTNTIARGVMAEITKTEPERKLYFEMFAYHLSEAPPTITLENGEQVPMCDEVICDDNVYVQFTPMANYQGAGVPFTHEKNANMYGFLQGWDVCSSNISTWTYATNWNNYLINYPDFDSITADLKIFSEMGVNRVYHQNQIHRRMPQMVEMRIFIESELMWNLSLSYDELAAEFIENYYGDAAPHIQQMYTTMTSYWAYLKDELDWIGGVYKNYRVKDKWPFQYVDAIRKMFVKAFDAIEPLKETDAAAYEKYYWRVCNAYLENLFMQMEFYGAEYGETYAQEAISLFQAIIQRFDYNYMGDGSSNPLTNYIKKWRAAYV